VESVAVVRASPEVQILLGAPIESGEVLSGVTEIIPNPPFAHAVLSYSVSGPLGDATVRAVADRTGSTWLFSALVVEVASGGRRIELARRRRVTGESWSFSVPAHWSEMDAASGVTAGFTAAGPETQAPAVVTLVTRRPISSDLGVLRTLIVDEAHSGGRHVNGDRSEYVGSFSGYQIESETAVQGRQGRLFMDRGTLYGGQHLNLSCSVPLMYPDDERIVCDSILSSFRVGEN